MLPCSHCINEKLRPIVLLYLNINISTGATVWAAVIFVVGLYVTFFSIQLDVLYIGLEMNLTNSPKERTKKTALTYWILKKDLFIYLLLDWSRWLVASIIWVHLYLCSNWVYTMAIVDQRHMLVRKPNLLKKREMISDTGIAHRYCDKNTHYFLAYLFAQEGLSSQLTLGFESFSFLL